MRPQHVMFAGLLFAGGTLISLTFGGSWLGSSDVSIVNSLTVFKEASILGIWSVTIPNVDFFFTGMKSVMMLDFAFFSSEGGSGMLLVQWFMMFTVIFGIMWGLFTLIIGVVASRFGR